MIIYPAIDIRGGRCVRLVEGDFARETVFDQDPSEAARRWESAGATHIHVVDLDGAKSGRPVNLDAIARIREAVSTVLQAGGGIRSVSAARQIFELGVDRVIAGSAIVADPESTRAMAAAFPGRIAAGLDARDGKLATDGWVNQSDMLATDAAAEMVALGISTIIYTDIRRDGTLSGPNISALMEMVTVVGTEVISSGGIGSLDDIDDVAATGAAGLIIGRALYDGRVNLADALKWQ